MRKGIFGGSFDPVHTGHLEIARSFLNCGLIDQLIVLPAPEPPHKRSKKQVAFYHRLRMLKIAFSDWERVSVSGLEEELPKPSYTLQTIRYLKEKEPQVTFFLCIGEDNHATFQHWWHYKDILEEVTLLVAKRPGIDKPQTDETILEHTVFVENDVVDLSSTELRIAENPGALKGKVPERVAQYIREHHLYGAN